MNTICPEQNSWDENGNSVQVLWYDNDQLMKRQTFRDWKPEGECKWWYQNGHLHEHSFYTNGRENGNHKEWYNNGRIMVCAFNQDGKYEGEGKSWYKSGEIWEHKFFRHGTCIDERFTYKKKIILLQIKKKLILQAFDICNVLSNFLINDLIRL